MPLSDPWLRHLLLPSRHPRLRLRRRRIEPLHRRHRLQLLHRAPDDGPERPVILDFKESGGDPQLLGVAPGLVQGLFGI